ILSSEVVGKSYNLTFYAQCFNGVTPEAPEAAGDLVFNLHWGSLDIAGGTYDHAHDSVSITITDTTIATGFVTNTIPADLEPGIINQFWWISPEKDGDLTTLQISPENQPFLRTV